MEARLGRSRSMDADNPLFEFRRGRLPNDAIASRRVRIAPNDMDIFHDTLGDMNVDATASLSCTLFLKRYH